jgi:hypothetical protein
MLHSCSSLRAEARRAKAANHFRSAAPDRVSVWSAPGANHSRTFDPSIAHQESSYIAGFPAGYPDNTCQILVIPNRKMAATADASEPPTGALTRKEPGHAQHTTSTQRRGRALRRCRRILAALPLVKRSADRDRHVQVALVHAVRSIAAGTVRPGERNSAA